MSKPLSLRAFMAHIAAATKKAGYTVKQCKGTLLIMEMDGAVFRPSMQTAYDAYQLSPDRLADIVDAHLHVLEGITQRTLPAGPANVDLVELAPAGAVADGEARVDLDEFLLPILQTTKWLKQSNKKMKLPVFQRPFLSGLVIAYVMDMLAMRAYLNTEMVDNIKANGATVDDLHNDALANLRRAAEEFEVQTYGRLEETLIVCETFEGYAAMSVLLPELMAEWDKRIPGPMLIGIPNRDFIIAFSERNPGGIDGIKGQVRKDARRKDHPLSARLLTWRDGAVREYEPLN